MDFLPVPHDIEGEALEYSISDVLPDEIIHDIFRIAASSSAETCRSLCLVSKWARDLVQHFLPGAVVLRDVRAKQDFEEFLRQQNEFYKLDRKSLVHSLWIGENAGDGSQVLEMCHNVTNFAMHADDFRLYFVLGWFQLADICNQSIDHLLAETASRRASSTNEDVVVTILDSLQGTSFNQDSPDSLMGNIRRLRLLKAPLCDIPFTAFSRLTHLAFPLRFDQPYDRYTVENLLKHLSTLQILVTPACQNFEQEIELLLAREDDRRIYCVDYGSRDDENWEDEARGDRDWWKRAGGYTFALEERFPTA
jgi:hypothetical protein